MRFLKEQTDVDAIIKLVQIYLQTNFKTIHYRIYTQTDGFSDWKTNIRTSGWKRWRDDGYNMLNGGSEALDCFILQLKYKEPRIEFMIEREMSGILAFLDISIQNQSPKSIERKLIPRGIFIGALITRRIAN